MSTRYVEGGFSVQDYLRASEEKKQEYVRTFAKNASADAPCRISWAALKEEFEENRGQIQSCEHRAIAVNATVELEKAEDLIVRLTEEIDRITKQVGERERVFIMGPGEHG